MKKVVSFSLWGANEIYTLGAIRNSELKNDFFPDWEMWVYYDDSVPEDILKTLEKNNVVLKKRNSPGYVKATWRFLPAADETIDYFISRDADSRISERDKTAVEDWIMSNKDFHILRDHPVGHNWHMNAGMWGCKGGKIPDMESLIEQYSKTHATNQSYFDQMFLRDVIYHKTLNSLLSHDEYFNFEPFSVPVPRDRKLDNFAFVGESIKSDDTPNGDQRSTIITIYNNKKCGN